jgi:hypothetical protein
MVGLSVPRFYALLRAGVFPPPVYDLVSRRPHYTEEQQRACLEVRRRNLGINGKIVLFYARRLGSPQPPHRPSVQQPRAALGTASKTKHAETGEYLRGLGLHRVTAEQVEAALRTEYPQGTGGVDHGTVLGKLFVRLHRQDSADKART